MKTDERGCSTCPAGEERYEEFTVVFDPRRARRFVTRIQYDYRTPDGRLFSCVSKTVEEARVKRDAWLEKQQ